MPRTKARADGRAYKPGSARSARQRKKSKVAYAESEARMKQAARSSKSASSVMKEEARDVDTEKMRK